MNFGETIGVILLGVVVLGPFIYMFIPTRCGSCGRWRTISGSAMSFAGETIFHDAACKNCKTPMWVDNAGYIRHGGFLWLNTIPLEKQQENKYLKEAQNEVDEIAPNQRNKMKEIATEVKEYSLSLYITDDMEARNKCKQELWYGVYLNQENFGDTKWLKLPCPYCNKKLIVNSNNDELCPHKPKKRSR